ncbi:translocon-associated protein subunit alpha-like isoform X1 [Iris pallida]|nr:translocon-associated protein subunit alpha-like isoform X1 [Iris pallida]
MLVQNLTVQEFYNATVPLTSQATFPYNFAVSKYLQPGSFDLVGTIIYEIDQHPYQTVFIMVLLKLLRQGLFSVSSQFSL